MKKFFQSMIALAVLVAAGIPFSARAAEDEEPIITLFSDAQKEGAGGFGITLGTDTQPAYFDIDFGFGKEEVEVQPWTVEDGSIKGTYIACSPVKEVKIYGDASKLSLFRASGAYLTQADISKCTDLQVIDLSHNMLRSLDLTPQTKAYAIYLGDNPFTPQTPCVIGAPKPSLEILEVDIIDNFDPDFNLSDYPNIKTFDAYHNTGLYQIDASGCPELILLSLEMTNVSKIDVSKNLKLASLNVSETRIRDLDVSNNQNLLYLYAGHYSGTINTGYHLENLVLGNLPLLAVLDLAGNKLKSVDISGFPNLMNLFLTDNNLTSLDVSKNENLTSLMLNKNDMDFATLPLPKQTYSEYWYKQRELQVGSRQISKDTEIDLSKRVLRDGTETTAKVFRLLYDSEPQEVDPSAYVYADGKIKFTQAIADSVYVQYHNSVLNEYDLQTTPFMVKEASEIGKPSKIVSFTLDDSYEGSIQVYVGMTGASNKNPKTFYADFGDGTLKTYQSKAEGIPSSPSIYQLMLSGGGDRKVDIYIPEGDVMTAFSISSTPLKDIDVTHATELRELSVTGCGIETIDLTHNRCLQSLNLQGNKLTNMDLRGCYGNYEKNVLTTVNASKNQLTDFYILSRGSVRSLNLSENKLKEYDLKDFDNLDVLDLSKNEIEGELNLAYLADASSINISSNNISALKFDSFNRLRSFNISDNNLTLQTLPLMPEVSGYVYAPMKPLELLANAPAVNISDQNRVIDGKGTAFVWKKATDGTPLVEGVDMTCKDGATKFLKTDLGKVYCEMTNPAFPQLDGENAWKTTEVNVVGAPTNVVATFTTTEDGTGEIVLTGSRKTSLYIDWRGDGTEFTPYPVETSYTSYPGQRTFAGAEVKVYTYEDPIDITVFSLYGMPLAEVDVTPLTGLKALAIGNAGLTPDKMKLPEAALTEFNLEGNGLTEYPYFEKYPDVQTLNLSNNKLAGFDASGLQTLTSLYLNHNEITSVKFNNPNLWELALDYNKLEQIDLNGLKALTQLSLANNLLSTIDLKPVGRNITALSLVANKFTFATLPVQSKYPKLLVYFYGSQAPIEPVISEDFMSFDLSSQAVISENNTTYRWFLGQAVYDPESGTLSGEELIADEEYTVKDGITTFLDTFDDKVMCVMTNPLFPKAFMYTPLYKVGEGTHGIEGITDDMPENVDGPVDVYTIQGTIVKRQVERSQALEGLSRGLYIVGGKKVLVK